VNSYRPAQFTLIRREMINVPFSSLCVFRLILDRRTDEYLNILSNWHVSLVERFKFGNLFDFSHQLQV
jgi:hypothetical protein